MIISHWPMEKIMQLPDNLFGQRFVIGHNEYVSDDSVSGVTLEATLPERFVIWELGVQLFVEEAVDGRPEGHLSLWLVGARSTVAANIRNGVALFPYTSTDDGPNNTFGHGTVIRAMRMPVERRGQWLAMIFASGPILKIEGKVWLVISAVPNSIPDGIGQLYE